MLQDIFTEIVIVVHHLQIVLINEVFDSLKVILGVTMGFLEDIGRINKTQIGFHVFTKVVCRDGHICHDVGDTSQVFQVRHLLSRNGSVRAIQFLESWNDTGSGQMSPGTEHEAVIHLLLFPDIKIMFALLCKPIAVPTPSGNVALRTKDCRIAYVKPSQVQEGVYELEILEAPPVNVSESD
jgi:hypothetical protein